MKITMFEKIVLKHFREKGQVVINLNRDKIPNILGYLFLNSSNIKVSNTKNEQTVFIK